VFFFVIFLFVTFVPFVFFVTGRRRVQRDSEMPSP
jgi:hypothetical protein